MPQDVGYFPPNSDEITPFDTRLLDHQLKTVAQALMAQQGANNSAANFEQTRQQLLDNPNLAAQTAVGRDIIEQNFAGRNERLRDTPELERMLNALAQTQVPQQGQPVSDEALGLASDLGQQNASTAPDVSSGASSVSNSVPAAPQPQNIQGQPPTQAAPLTQQSITQDQVPTDSSFLDSALEALIGGGAGAAAGAGLHHFLNRGANSSVNAGIPTTAAPILEGDLVPQGQLAAPNAQATPAQINRPADIVGQLGAPQQALPNDVPNFASLETGGPAFPPRNFEAELVAALGMPPQQAAPTAPQQQPAQPAQQPTRTGNVQSLDVLERSAQKLLNTEFGDGFLVHPVEGGIGVFGKDPSAPIIVASSIPELKAQLGALTPGLSRAGAEAAGEADQNAAVRDAEMKAAGRKVKAKRARNAGAVARAAR